MKQTLPSIHFLYPLSLCRVAAGLSQMVSGWVVPYATEQVRHKQSHMHSLTPNGICVTSKSNMRVFTWENIQSLQRGFEPRTVLLQGNNASHNPANTPSALSKC
ncbi:hypothetical protein GOODEAATRI_001478 [Goodea atripinnis]|uniref:Secreted protein n=1 Tax=Goodea atripinnis TaxID=208336 RepID=A0ABV0ME57_9TELE